jgi:hypothetical protein
LIPESISKIDNAKRASPSTSCSSIDTIVANENPAVKHNANIAHRIRATFHSFVPEQLPNRLRGKYSVTKVMIVSLLALMGALGKETRQKGRKDACRQNMTECSD